MYLHCALTNGSSLLSAKHLRLNVVLPGTTFKGRT